MVDILQHMFCVFILYSPKLYCVAILLLTDLTPALHTGPRPPGLYLSLLNCKLLIYGVQHTIWDGIRHIFFYVLYVFETVMDYQEPVIQLLEINWWVFKNLLECDFRRNLVCYWQGYRRTDYYYFCHRSQRT